VRPAAGQHRRAEAFTLIELMVVMFIIGVLVAMVVGVGKYVYDEAGRKETRSILTVVQSAVEQYKEVAGDYPDDAAVTGVGPANSSRVLLYHFKGSDPGSETMQKRIRDASGTYILKLPSDSYSGGDKILDSFGNELRYEKAGGFGGKPVVISPGPDGQLGTADDLRSDR